MAVRELKIGASGVRGVVGDALTPELIVDFACAFGTWCGARARQLLGGYASHVGRQWARINCD